jgi:hypothetical protein
MQKRSKCQSRLARTTFFFLSIVAILALAACQESKITPTRNVSVNDVQIIVTTPTGEPYLFKTPEPGTITAHGLLLVLDPMTLAPAPDDPIYLVPIPEAGVSTIPQFEIGTVPQAEVNEGTGEFLFTNLQPGDYAVVVVTKGGAQIPARYYEIGNFAIFKVQASQTDTVIELGKLSLP